MKLKEILTARNMDGKIYISDIDKFLKYKVPMKEVVEIRDSLMEIVTYGKDN